MNEGLKTSLNKIREISSTIYHQYIPEITADTDISKLAAPVLEVPEVYNEFCNALVNRIVYTQFIAKSFRNPFVVLEGDAIPLGYAGQEVYTNPAKGRVYNANDFAGLLVKYEADVKVQYTTINMDVQYPVTFSRQQLKKAFVSWGDLESFIDGLSNSLYNGAYIDEYNATKQLISGAYKDNIAVIETVSAISSESAAKDFITKARELYLQFQTPSDKYNAWHKNGGEGRPVVTWSNPEDIVFIVRNDIRSYLDVNVMASAFNIDKATLLGNILTINDFDIYNEDGTKNFDGSSIVGMIADKSWFRIKRQDMFMDSFYNPNNRSIQYYLNNIKMYNMSLFANGVIFATEEPSVAITGLSYGVTSVTIDEVGDIEGLEITVQPPQANTPAIVYTTDDTDGDVITIDDTSDPKIVRVTAVGEGTKHITATAGQVSTTIEVTVPTSA
jgi:hypothetical protein